MKHHKEWQAATISKIHWFVFTGLETKKIGMFQTFQLGDLLISIINLHLLEKRYY